MSDNPAILFGIKIPLIIAGTALIILLISHIVLDVVSNTNLAKYRKEIFMESCEQVKDFYECEYKWVNYVPLSERETK